MKTRSLIYGLPLALAVLMAGCATTAPQRPQPTVEIPVERPPAPAEVPADAADKEQRVRASREQVVVALLNDADQQTYRGELDGAVASLERALRISPRNPVLWQRLASVRLQQGRYPQAEQLAAKSNAMAGDNVRLRARNWEIIAQAREFQGDSRGAEEAYRYASQARSTLR